MKKTLAIVLALAMVLCMIPAAFATRYESVSNKSYDMTAYTVAKDGSLTEVASDKGVNALTVEYNYEKMDEVVTGKFTEDKKMVMVNVSGFDSKFNGATDIKVTIDGKKLEVNDGAVYGSHVRFDGVNGFVVFPVEATKAGYSDTYLIEVEGTVNKGDAEKETVITETAKVSLKLVNTAEYKNAKTATISKIESKNANLDAYIVGSKIYFDFVNKEENLADAVEITFKDENGNLFSSVTWAYAPVSKAGTYSIINKPSEEKLSDSKTKYNVSANTVKGNADAAKEIVFKLETSGAKYETKAYDVVVRTDIKEADPQGIYFAESTKTITIGEDYTPVVMGVATGKKVNATLAYGDNTAKEVIYIDGDTVTGTKEGVAYITASYKTTAASNKEYKASSMKIVVTAGEVVEPSDGAKYVVTASSLNVRSGAGTGYSKIGSLKNGAIVEVETIANGWAKLADGGYVSSQYLAKVVEDGEAVTMYVTCRTLNVRKGPGTSYAKAGTLSRGTAVQVVGMTGSWAKLSNGTYVSANYLSK